MTANASVCSEARRRRILAAVPYLIRHDSALADETPRQIDRNTLNSALDGVTLTRPGPFTSTVFAAARQCTTVGCDL